MNPSWFLAIPFAAIGASAAIGGVFLLKRGLCARFRGVLVEATVVGRTPNQTPDFKISSHFQHFKGTTVTPQLRYRSADGTEITATLASQSRQRMRSEGFRLRYKLGEVVRVRVDPRQPEIAYENSIGGTLIMPGLLVGAGALMSLLALGIVLGSQ